ncbi:DUF4136 domain-containing protein [Hymenobacter sp. BT186]|uniref:DUF4136 domain-containing protein n=1 Tax=Hymenobacter telluris TaxID=2816474 RepID=A0A939JAR7_9BACT|nr:DUF4136 domain-containing protein [Hymenobacter telluris]MBO0358391.1 DUF4136 domain-containing protein [Hymenobacter telluris]MBW3374417.1 DUF4136 domain-containing protein [Hymenobacter norwichensis]
MKFITRLFARPAALVAIGFSLILGVTGCATSSRVGVTSDFDHSVNFRAYKTWAWYPQQAVDAEGGPAKGYESFLDQRLQAAVERELSAKGLTRVDKAPDLYIAYSAKVEEKQQVSPYYNGLGYPYYGYGYYGRGAYTPVTQYKAGTVIIDFVDAKRKELAWRGTGQAQVDNQSISEEEVHRIVNGILGNYPPNDANARR